MSKYEIIIKTSKGTTDLISNPLYSPYELPWTFNGTKSYNPEITNIIDFIEEDEQSPSFYRKSFLFNLEMEVYRKKFQSRFSWENFKNDIPESFAILRDTISPERFSVFKGLSAGFFRSSRLPRYALTRFFFKQGDITELHAYKIFEDTLANLFKHQIFCFDT